jgi:coenzyme F420 hydrogenase subunit beta
MAMHHIRWGFPVALTAVLLALLEGGRIDGALLVRQGSPRPRDAEVVIARDAESIRACAQSVYIPVSTLDILGKLTPGERYAMTVLPDQAAALRAMQLAGHEGAGQVEYVLGPYTGTALQTQAIDFYLRFQGVKRDDAVTSLKWRAGEWPGYLEIQTESGRVMRSPKIYYNYLIPFFITQNSLQSIDFANEFCDLSVGDAWSPRFEAAGGGHSILVARSPAMERVLAEMTEAGLLEAETVDEPFALSMHGHMMDFKKRGAFIRNRFRGCIGLKAPRYDLRPEGVPFSRLLVEGIISGVFLAGRLPPLRWLFRQVPESWVGPAFNRLRLSWKNLSKPTKRKGLARFKMVPADGSDPVRHGRH